MNDVTIASLLFAAVGFLYIGLGIPLFRCHVKPNGWYGCRTTKTLSNEKIWYAVNRVTGRDLIGAGVGLLISSMVVFLLRNTINSDVAAAFLLAVLVIGVAIMVIDSLRAQRHF